MKVINKQEAKSLGLKRYFNGKVCKHGHIDERFVTNSQCVKCSLDKVKSRKEYHAEKSREWAKSNPKKCASYSAKYRSKNPGKIVEASKIYRSKNKETLNKYCLAYQQKNMARFLAANAEYRASKLQATPSWSDLEKIKEIYIERAKLEDLHGIKYHVDHIIPLKHTLVCGLHVPANLRIITAEENLAKNNKFEIE